MYLMQKNELLSTFFYLKRISSEFVEGGHARDLDLIVNGLEFLLRQAGYGPAIDVGVSSLGKLKSEKE